MIDTAKLRAERGKHIVDNLHLSMYSNNPDTRKEAKKVIDIAIKKHFGIVPQNPKIVIRKKKEPVRQMKLF